MRLPFRKHKPALRPAQQEPVLKEVIQPIMVSPEQFVAMKGRSLLTDRTWYAALYLVQSQPEISAAKLGKALQISHVTAGVVRQQVRTALHAASIPANN